MMRRGASGWSASCLVPTPSRSASGNAPSEASDPMLFTFSATHSELGQEFLSRFCLFRGLSANSHDISAQLPSSVSASPTYLHTSYLSTWHDRLFYNPVPSEPHYSKTIPRDLHSQRLYQGAVYIEALVAIMHHSFQGI